MGRIKDSNILFFVTSPRTPFKMIPEIKLLTDNLSGQAWDKTTQREFANLLAASSVFHGYAKNNKGFSARDRITRAPKGLGFVDLKPTIQLTRAGEKLLTSTRPHEIFTRQLLKFQLPSPYHIDKKSNFFVKPYLEILRLIYDLGSISKDELRMFGLQLIDYRYYEDIKNQILTFRNEVKSIDRRVTSYKKLSKNKIDEIIKKIYEVDISNLDTSDEIKKYIEKKKNNSRDYADACFRYIRATQLVTVNKQGSCLFVSSDKIKEVEYILDNVDRVPQKFASEEEYKNYLFNPTIPVLAIDDKNELLNILTSVGTSSEKLINKNIFELQDLQERIIQQHKIEKISKIVKTLKTFEKFNEINDLYTSIIAKEVTDQPLMLEWNTWRAFTMLSDGNIHGNFKLDTEGMPLSTASGNMPDIECNYRDFNMIVEVTMSSGKRQYEMEGEPVARHLGELKRKNNGSENCYCIFIAPKVNEATLAHFYILHNSKVKYYGGRSKIIPLNLDMFLTMLSHARENQSVINSTKLKNYLEKICDVALQSSDEDEWFSFIENTVNKWMFV